ncbi:hypothetical protein E1258_09255 [Micromonospora sp. KC207]|nr:hypothetical protein E1258_09255 [Micromonospora sp. KC207]
MQVTVGLVQAIAAALALLIAGLALHVAEKAFSDQRELNGKLGNSLELEERRYLERYASRVAWWRPGNYVFKIQNRSTVPISGVRIVPERRDYQWGFIQIGDVPPCSIATITVDDSELLPDITTSSAEVLPTRPMLEFFDPFGKWSKSEFDRAEQELRGGPGWDSEARKAEEIIVESRGVSAKRRIGVEPVSDCTDGL